MPFMSIAKTVITYSYDAAGNRTSRTATTEVNTADGHSTADNEINIHDLVKNPEEQEFSLNRPREHESTKDNMACTAVLEHQSKRNICS